MQAGSDQVREEGFNEPGTTGGHHKQDRDSATAAFKEDMFTCHSIVQ